MKNKKLKYLMDVLIPCLLLTLCGCLDPEGTIGQFFLDPATKDGVDTATGFGSLFGPIGTTVGSALAGTYAIGRSYFATKKANKEKEEALSFEEQAKAEGKRLKAAFDGLVDGVQKTREKLPPEVDEKAKELLSKHTPDWVRELVDESKGKSQKYLG